MSEESVTTRWRAILIAVLGFAAISSAFWLPAWPTAAFVLGSAALFLVSSTLSIAGRTARSLQPFLDARVRVLVWGVPLPASDGLFYVESIAALGVGLLIKLQLAPGAPGILLKIAQPRDVLLSERVAIGGAAYIQWSGRRLAPSASHPSPALVLERA